MTIAKEHLMRPTTYREFIARLLGDDGLIDAQLLKRVEEREAVIAAKMLPGDELWEFVLGDQAFAMAGGLAIVRAGEVAESWTEWRS